jgi:chitinase
MKKTLSLAILLSCGLISSVFASAAPITSFSPYVDLTLNVHWDSSTQDLQPVDLVQISQTSGVKNYHLAFITDAGQCQPTWGGQQAYSMDKGWGSRLTEKLHSNQIQYTVSFGGASGNDISLACSESQLISVYEQAIKIYQPQGLDFDIENGTANVKKIMTALKQIQLDHPNLKISFTLPVMPEGLTPSGQEVVQLAKTNDLKYTVNIMAMDYGPSYVNDMGEYAIQAATNLFNFLKTLYPESADEVVWQMVEVTPMIGINDVTVEQFSLRNADLLNRFARQNHLGGLSMWSIARDNPCADKWASSICSGNNLQIKSYDFSEHLMSQL